MNGKAWMGLSVTLALVGMGMLAAPLRWWHPDLVQPLELSALKSEQGHAFLMPFASEQPSDRDGGSPIVLYEDGRELGPAHALHGVIREQGRGAFSHWGPNLYFSASDNSDPRSNGRRYEVHLAAPSDGRSGVAGLALLVVAAVMALGAAAATVRARRTASATAASITAGGALAMVVVAAVIVAGGALSVLVARRAHETRHALEELAGSFTLPDSGTDQQESADAPGPDGPDRPDGRAGPRTMRLLDDAVAPAFVASGPPRTPRPPVIASLPPVMTLAPGAEAASAAALALRPEDVAEVQLTLRVRRGRNLVLAFTLQADAEAGSPDANLGREYRVLLDVPVEPSEDWQTLSVNEPIRLAGQWPWGNAPVLIRRLSLGNAMRAPDELELEARDAVLSGPGALYSRTTHGSGRLEVGDDLRPAWWQSTAGESTLPLVGAAGRRLRGAVAVSDPERVGGAASYRVEVEDALGRRRALASGTLDASAGWLDLQADLPVDMPADRAPVRLVFGSDDLPQGLVLAWSSLRCIDLARPARRAVLVLVDTLRADATGFSGGSGGDTPMLDALAAQGASFTRCYSQASWTRPSMPSILTGRYVAATGVQFLGQRLPARYETIAESFGAAGFHTLAILSNTNAGVAAGLEQGFDELVQAFDPSIDDTREFLARHVVPRLERLPDDDLFLSVHLMEVHEPFGPRHAPADWREPAGKAVATDVHLDRPWVAAPSVASRRALYALDVRNTDRELGTFLQEWLARWEARGGNPVALAIASDHGEMLGESGRWGHAWGPMTTELLHVPLLLRAPGRIAPGTRCKAIVQNVDIGVTLLELAGVPRGRSASSGSPGRSLLPLLETGDRAGPHQAVAGLETGAERMFTVITRDETLMGESGRLIAPPPSATDWMAGRSPPRVGIDTLLERESTFKRTWEAYLLTQEAWRRQLWEGSDAETRTVDPGAMEQLQALGYFGR